MTVTFDTSFEDDTVEIEISPEDKKWFDDQEAQGESCANVPNTSSVEMQGGPCSIPGVSSVFNIDKQEVERSHSKCRCIEEHQDGRAHSAHVQRQGSLEKRERWSSTGQWRGCLASDHDSGYHSGHSTSSSRGHSTLGFCDYSRKHFKHQRQDSSCPEKSGNFQTCCICKKQIRHVQRHMHEDHLPWYWTLYTTCWKCKEDYAVPGKYK